MDKLMNPFRIDGPRITRNRTIHSCRRCRERRVRCDRRSPACSNCLKANAPCVPTEAASSKKNTHSSSPDSVEDRKLHERLDFLERKVQLLLREKENRLCDLPAGACPRCGLDYQEQEQQLAYRRSSAPTEPAPKVYGDEVRVERLETQLKGLLLSRPRTVYLSPSSWAALADEGIDLQHICDNSKASSAEASHSSDQYFEACLPIENEDGGRTFTNSFKQYPLPPYTFNEIGKQDTVNELLQGDSELVKLFDIFATQVDPFIRIIHKPSVKQSLKSYLERRRSQQNQVLSELPEGTPKTEYANHGDGGVSDSVFEALLLAICYAALASMNNDSIRRDFPGLPYDRQRLMELYGRATETALARSNFLENPELESLQALVIFLSITPPDYNARVTWIRVGLAIRIAQSMGLHREGTLYGLSALHSELRRRLWAQLRLLDFRTSEELGCEATITEGSFDVWLPMNVNDEALTMDVDIPQKQTECPEPNVLTPIQDVRGQFLLESTVPEAHLPKPHLTFENAPLVYAPRFTEMTFSLIRYECLGLFSQLLRSRYRPKRHRRYSCKCKSDDEIFNVVPSRTKEEVDSWIDQVEQRLMHTYSLNQIDPSVPIQRLTADMAHILIAKARFVANLVFWKSFKDKMGTEIFRQVLTHTALELLEMTIEIQQRCGPCTPIWSPASNWCFSAGSQFHALSFILSALAKGSLEDADAYRSKTVIAKLFPHYQDVSSTESTVLSGNKSSNVHGTDIGVMYGDEPDQSEDRNVYWRMLRYLLTAAGQETDTGSHMSNLSASCYYQSSNPASTSIRSGQEENLAFPFVDMQQLLGNSGNYIPQLPGYGPGFVSMQDFDCFAPGGVVQHPY